MASYLENLNEAQLRAVTHDPAIPLQILAGPGSGKTRVLTSRVAHLVEHHRIPPEDICCVTFTNKAAKEMRARLKKILGPERTSQLRMGTFHALCARYLRAFGDRIAIPNNFSICDADESKAVLKELLKREETIEDLKACCIKMEAPYVQTQISRAKAKGHTFRDLRDQIAQKQRENPNRDQTKQDSERIVADLYEAYEEEMRKMNALDFDDLLVCGVRLFRSTPGVVAHLRHVLVDEFQDTNTMQFDLMKLLAAKNKCVSIVGDPDQSIYGWRSADVTNLAKMREVFPGTDQIFLEENYRSTGAILDASLCIISRDQHRIVRGLRTSRAAGLTPSLIQCQNELREADFVAYEIKRVIANSGGKMNFNDVAILLRFHSQTMHLEGALRKAGVPCRILGGTRFFDRAEVKDVIAYLQLVDNPDFKPAFSRAVNTPKRGLGKKSIDQILLGAAKGNMSPMAYAEAIVKRKVRDVSPPARNKLAPFVKIIADLREESLAGMSAVKVINHLLTMLEYQEHLRTTYKDEFEPRWEHVEQLIEFAKDIEGGDKEDEFDLSLLFPGQGENLFFERTPTGDEDEDEGGEETLVALPPPTPVPDVKGKGKARATAAPARTPSGSGGKNDAIDLTLDDGDEDEDGAGPIKVDDDEADALDLHRDDATAPAMYPLRHFLEASMLSTDTESADETKIPKVTMCTCHSAKGLEWPVVFVPGAEEGTFPFFKSEDPDEERRLLYVACTRAQGYLYLTYTKARTYAGKEIEKQASKFIFEAMQVKPEIFRNEVPVITLESMTTLFAIMGRDLPTQEEIDTLVAALPPAVLPLITPVAPTASSSPYRRSTYGGFQQSQATSYSSPSFSQPQTQVSFSSSVFQSINAASASLGGFSSPATLLAGRGAANGSAIVAPLPPTRNISSQARSSPYAMAAERRAANTTSQQPQASSSSSRTTSTTTTSAHVGSSPYARPRVSTLTGTHLPAPSPSQSRFVVPDVRTATATPRNRAATVAVGVSKDDPVVVDSDHDSDEVTAISRAEAEASSNTATQSQARGNGSGRKRLGMRGPLKPFGAPKEKRVKTE